MRFDHRVSVDAPPERVWPLVMDIPQAAACIPGAHDVRALDDGRYQGTVRVQVGPVTVSVQGTMALKEQDATARRAVMELEGADRRVGGGVRGTMTLELGEPSPGRTELRVGADITFIGRLAELGQHLVRRKAEALLQEFARNLAARAQG